SLAAPTSSPSASWICAGNTRSAAAAAVTTVGPDTFLMAVPPVSNGLQRPRTLPTAADGAGGTAAQTSTRSRTTSAGRALAPRAQPRDDRACASVLGGCSDRR